MSLPVNSFLRGPRWWSAVLLLAAAAAITLLPRPEAELKTPRFSAIPVALGTLRAEDVPIEERMVKAANVDHYLNRVYRGPDGDAGLYVGYYRSQRAGDSVHSPKNCLPGGGWQAVRAGRIALPLANGARPQVNLYLVENAGERIVVLYWYQSHGEITASEYAAKLHTMRDAILYRRTDTALVRITVPIEGGEDEATRKALDFSALVAPYLNQALPQ
ncbi:MAG: EpsI family protein [Acidobacteriota bacterium]|nr:EpsI family protein [Acidobacteriota bacterium]